MKYISIAVALILTLGTLTLVGCGANSDGKLVTELLTEISRGNWDVAFDLTHPAMVYCGPDKEAFVSEMPHYGKELEEFFRGAQFKVIDIKHEDTWSDEGIAFADVSRVTVSMSTPTERQGIDEYQVTKEFASSGQAELIVAIDPMEDKETRKAVFSYGSVKPAYYVRYATKDNEYASPVPNYTISDPEPGQNVKPSSLNFFDVFDEDYQKKYVACVLNINNIQCVLAINQDEEVLYLNPTDPPLDPGTAQMTKHVWDSFVTLKPEDIAGHVPPVPENYEYSYVAEEMKEKVAQAMKLFVIMNDGYGKYKDRFPGGILAITSDVKMIWPVGMVDTQGNPLLRDNYSGDVAFIHVSSCGSCMNVAADVWDELVGFGMPKNHIIFISKSMKDKLGDFEKRVEGSSLVIDPGSKQALPLGLYGTPSMTVIDSDLHAVVNLDSYEIKDSFKLNRAMSMIFKR